MMREITRETVGPLVAKCDNASDNKILKAWVEKNMEDGRFKDMLLEMAEFNARAFETPLEFRERVNKEMSWTYGRELTDDCLYDAERLGVKVIGLCNMKETVDGLFKDMTMLFNTWPGAEITAVRKTYAGITLVYC